MSLRRGGVAAAALVAAATLPFVGCLWGELLYDDDRVVHHPVVEGKVHWTAAFTTDFWGLAMTSRFSHKSYRPLAILSFWLSAQLFGTEETVSYHAVNMLLHTLCTLLVSRVTRLVAGTPRAAFAAALLFAVHPLHTETVCCITYRADLMSSALFLLGLWAYIACENDAAQQWRARLLFLSFVASGLAATLCKEQGITLFGVVVVYDVLRMVHRRRAALPASHEAARSDVAAVRATQSAALWATVERIALVAVVLAVVMALRLRVNYGSAPTWNKHDNIAVDQPLFERTLTLHYLAATQLLWLLWPATLCHDWNHESVEPVLALSDWRNLQAVLVYGIAAAVLRYGLRGAWPLSSRPAAATTALSHRALLSSPALCILAAAVTVCSFLPASNLFFLVGFTLAERVMYLPSVGFCVFAGWAYDAAVAAVAPHAADVCESPPHSCGTAAAVATVAPCSDKGPSSTSAAATAAGSVGARHTVAAGTHTAGPELNGAASPPASPRAATAHRRLFIAGLLVVVACFVRTAVRATAWVDFATLLEADVVSNPSNSKNWYSHGHQFHQREEWDKALELYRVAESKRRGYPEPLLNMAFIHIQQNRTSEGRAIHIEMLDKMVERNPSMYINDRNHVSLYGAICVNLARETSNRTRSAHYVDMADRIVSHVRTDELDGNLARLIGDTHALLGNFSRAEVWFDRAMQRVDDLHFNEMMTTLMYFGQVAEVSYLEQQTSGRVAIGAYLYQKSDAMLWYDRMYSLANGTLHWDGINLRLREFQELAARVDSPC